MQMTIKQLCNKSRNILSSQCITEESHEALCSKINEFYVCTFDGCLQWGVLMCNILQQPFKKIGILFSTFLKIIFHYVPDKSWSEVRTLNDWSIQKYDKMGSALGTGTWIIVHLIDKVAKIRLDVTLKISWYCIAHWHGKVLQNPFIPRKLVSLLQQHHYYSNARVYGQLPQMHVSPLLPL